MVGALGLWDRFYVLLHGRTFDSLTGGYIPTPTPSREDIFRRSNRWPPCSSRWKSIKPAKQISPLLVSTATQKTHTKGARQISSADLETATQISPPQYPDLGMPKPYNKSVHVFKFLNSPDKRNLGEKFSCVLLCFRVIDSRFVWPLHARLEIPSISSTFWNLF